MVGETEAGGQGGGSPFPSYPSLPNHTGRKHIGGGEAQMLPSPGKGCTKPHPLADTSKTLPPHQGAGQGYTEVEHCELKGQGKPTKSPYRQVVSPSCPLSTLSPKSIKCPSALLGHSPMASSFFFPTAGDKKKKGTEQGAKVYPLAPVPHTRWSVPCPQ